MQQNSSTLTSEYWKKMHSFGYCILTHTRGKNRHLRRGEYSESFSMLCLHHFIRPRTCSTDRAGILALKTSRWFLCCLIVSRWKQFNFIDSDKWGPGTGNTWFGSFLLCCTLSCLISHYLCKLKEAGLMWQVNLHKKILSHLFLTNEASNSLWQRKVKKYTAIKLFWNFTF